MGKILTPMPTRRPTPIPTPHKKKRPAPRFDTLVAAYPLIAVLVKFLSDCYAVVDAADPAALTAFIQRYRDSEIGPLATYVAGLQQDYEAVANSLRYPDISNGPLEGVNSRIKMKHRRGAGRAGIELLNAYNVLRVEDLVG